MSDRTLVLASNLAARTGARPVLLLAPLLVAGIPFAAYAGMVLHHFYLSGAFYWDTGLLGYLLRDGGLSLRQPAVSGGASYFAIHVTPIFIISSAIARWLPLSMPQCLAAFAGICHAVPGLAVYWLLTARCGLRTAGGALLAAAVAIAFAFNGLALAIARYPHFEILIAGAIITFVVVLGSRRPRWAIVPFVVGLAVREDAGFQFCAILVVLVVLDRWYGVRRDGRRAALGYAAAGLIYSIVVIAIQHAVFADSSALNRVYLGDPLFANITAQTVLTRLRGYLLDRSYIFLPCLYAVVWTARERNPYIVAGYIAFLPWVALHLVANSDIAGSLSGYYAYPLLVAMFWPLVGTLSLPQAASGKLPPRRVVAHFTVMILLSASGLSLQYNPGRLSVPGSLVTPPSTARQAATDRAIALLLQRKAELAPLRVDGSILALTPDGFSPAETIADGSASPRTVVYFDGGYEAPRAAAIAATAGLDNLYAVPGTQIRIALSGPPGRKLAGLPLTPVPPDSEN